jgi:hypothetical protein
MAILIRSIEAQRKGEGIRSVMEMLLTNTSGEVRGEEAAKIKKIFDYASTIPEDVADMIINIPDLEEIKILEDSLDMLKNTIGVTELQIYLADDMNAPNYKGKKKEALPLRPGIYIE